MDHQVCFRCHVAKPLDEFYKHPMMANGRLGKCKVCTRKDVQDNYAKRREQYLAYEKTRQSPERVRKIKERKSKYPQRQKARVIIHNDIARGKITRQPCEVCGNPKVDAHHPDYSKPREVNWLCRKHHMERHRMEPPVNAV